MLKFVVDEDMSRSTSKIMKDRGFEVLDVRDCGLRGKSDEVSTSELNRQINAAFDNLSESDLKGNLIILEPGKIRVRRR